MSLEQADDLTVLCGSAMNKSVDMLHHALVRARL